MRRFVLACALPVLVMTGACGGPQVPTHGGYKSAKSKPWQKAKLLAWNEKYEVKSDGELDYAKYQRAKWYMLDLPGPGELSLKVEITPPGDAVNDDFDLAIEILDPSNRVISKADNEEDDVGELNKTRVLYDLSPGRYYIHLYLQGRLDTADFTLRASFKRAGAAEVKSDFPARVSFLPALPMVPLNDDTPRDYVKPKAAVVRITRRTPRAPTPAPAAAAAKTARILAVRVAGGSTQIQIGMGIDHGLADGWKAKVSGVDGSWSLSNCTARSCSALVKATPDQIKSGGNRVSLSP